MQACAERRQVRLDYRSDAGSEWLTEVDPWAVVVRHGRWYLLCRSHAADAVRTYRVDRVRAVDVLDETFTPPADLDPVAVLEENLAVGWEYDVEVVISAPAEQPGLVCRAARGRPGVVPGRRLPGGPGVRAPPRTADAPVRVLTVRGSGRPGSGSGRPQVHLPNPPSPGRQDGTIAP